MNTSPTQPDDALDPNYIKIATIFQKYGEQCAKHGTGYFEHLENDTKPIKEVLVLLAAEVQATEKAYGGCHKCYGKGYATVIKGVKGYADFLGDKDFKIPPHNQMVYCSCERGKQLEALLSPIAGEGGKE